jgi:hypothetical protein
MTISVLAGSQAALAGPGAVARVIVTAGTAAIVTGDLAPSSSGPVTPAAFPSILSTSGRTIVDENGYTMPCFYGFNMHAVPWAQSDLNAIAALDTRAVPARLARFSLRWQQLQPTDGTSASSSYIASIDTQIARCVAAGIYVMFELHLNVGDAIPAWVTTGADDTDKFYLHGQWITRYLADRYGNPASAQYTKAVIGFGLNEPPVNGTVANATPMQSTTWLETRQSAIFGWMRTSGTVSGTPFQGAPNWIGFAALAYAQQTPLYLGPGENTAAADANPAAYNSVGGNVVIDFHDYFTRDRGFSADYIEDPNRRGRQYNGLPYSFGNGGPSMGADNEAQYLSTVRHRQQHTALLADYEQFCRVNNIPLMIGEWGWPQVTSSGAIGGSGVTTVGEDQFIDDKMRAWAACEPVAILHWNYDTTTNTALNPWAAKPGGTFRSSVQRWFTFATGGKQIVLDTMQGTASTLIAVRDGEVGADWSTVGDRTGLAISSAARCYSARYPAASDAAWSYASGVPASADYDLSLDLVVLSALGEAGGSVRTSTSAKTGIVLSFNAATNQLKLYDVVADVYTQLGATLAFTIAAGTQRSVVIRARGTTITVWVDGLLQMTRTTTITTAGRPGLWAYGQHTDSTGVHIDNVLAVDA